MNILNLMLVLIIIIILVVVYKNKREIEKSIIKKTEESQFPKGIGRKMNSVEVFNGKDSINIKDITKGNLLGILISSSCSHCMTPLC
ncbi:hypothetical protein [Sporosarcina sp. E16_8]|uniref:hypothetical protein n=1 Tax=Sporosarcina sp. E16_8 TaxID=2789295 RepID=UPI001A931113|nr:hypothetical protein [Sporosarcina sp. E16_8]MBO0587573.1 hypothetical protein [Sporosarcina sp. E16_8]MBO0602441.1 hypothetical protein [Sporosarcina sp. E16_3]